MGRALRLALAACALLARPALSQTIPMTTDERWSIAAERFVRRLQSGEYASAAADVSPDVPAGAMSAARLAQIWTQLTAQLGTLGELAPGDVSVEGARHVVNLRARFARSEVIVRVVLGDDAKVAGLWVAPPAPPAYASPAYVDSTAFVESEVTVGSGAYALPGTLTLPRGNQPVPIVVLVHGSGPSDRDETIGANRPFRDLAWGLASRGVGVLRYDKRTYVHGARLAAAGQSGVTPETEVVDDALLALNVARAHPQAAAGRIFLLGHSLGASLAPEIARRDGGLAGVIMLAAAARPIIDVTLEQIAYLRGLVPVGQGGADLDSAAALLGRLRTREIPADENVLGAPARYWYDLNARDPLAVARSLRVPTLVLQGGRDYQVTTEDFERWRTALGERSGASFVAYPDLNHLFMGGTGRATPVEYTGRAGHVAAGWSA